MGTLILAAIAVSIAVSSSIIIGRMLVRRREEPKRWEQDERPEPRERPQEGTARYQRRHLKLPRRGRAVVLVLAYWVSR